MVAAYKSVKSGHMLSCITFDYGQTTQQKEFECAKEIAKALDISRHFFVDLPFLKNFHSIAMIGGKVFLEYKNQELAYVPFRNGIMLSVAAAYAEVEGIDEILICTHLSDRICPDVSADFLNAMSHAINIGTKTRNEIKVFSPFKDLTKAQVVEAGYRLGVPFEFSWSCYNSMEFACGKCTNCLDRSQAFREAGIEDHIPYSNEMDGTFLPTGKHEQI